MIERNIKSMRKLRFYFIVELLTVFICAVFFGCDEGTLDISYFPFAKVSKCERDSIKTVISYNNYSDVSGYDYYVNDVIVSRSNVRYTPSMIYCTLDGLDYEIQLSIQKGVYRIEELDAKQTVDGHVVEVFKVRYTFDDENRLMLAHVSGSDLVDPNDPHTVWVLYKYEDNRIVIHEEGNQYIVELSAADNLGYVCNVLDFAGSPHTSKYVINPDLYFLNVFGAPILKLPKDQQVSYSSNNQLLRVGKYAYEY